MKDARRPDDPDDTVGRAIYRARADALAKFQMRPKRIITLKTREEDENDDAR